MKPWMRVLLPLLLALAVLAYWGLPEDHTQPVRLGLALNLSGTGGTAGEYIREGAMLAVEAVNGRGGIHGRPLELLIRDDGNTREGVITADQELLDAGVLAIIGHVTSENTLYAYEYLMSKDVLLFTPYTATTRLTGRDDLFFRTSVDTSLYGRAMARLLEQKGTESVAVLLDMANASFTVDYVSQLRRHFEGEIHETRFDSKQDVDWDEILTQLLTPLPAAVVLLTEVSRTGIAAQKLRAQGYTGPLIATLWAQTPDLMRFGGKAVEGLSLVTFIDPNNRRPAFLEFSRLIEQRLSRPANARSTRAYEAVTLLAEALRRSDGLSVSVLKRALLGGSFETLLGTVRFDEFGDVQRPVFEVKVQGGCFVTAQTLVSAPIPSDGLGQTNGGGPQGARPPGL